MPTAHSEIMNSVVYTNYNEELPLVVFTHGTHVSSYLDSHSTTVL